MASYMTVVVLPKKFSMVSNGPLPMGKDFRTKFEFKPHLLIFSNSTMGNKICSFSMWKTRYIFSKNMEKNKSDISTGDYQNYWVVSFEILAAVISKVDLNEASEFFTNQYNNYIWIQNFSTVFEIRFPFFDKCFHAFLSVMCCKTSHILILFKSYSFLLNGI